MTRQPSVLGCPSTYDYFTRGKCAEDTQQANIVFVPEESAHIDKLSITDLPKCGSDLLFLRKTEESIT